MQGNEHGSRHKDANLLPYTLTGRGTPCVFRVKYLNSPTVNSDVLAGYHKDHEGEDPCEKVHLFLLEHALYSPLQVEEDD